MPLNQLVELIVTPWFVLSWIAVTIAYTLASTYRIKRREATRKSGLDSALGYLRQLAETTSTGEAEKLREHLEDLPDLGYAFQDLLDGTEVDQAGATSSRFF